MTVRRSAKSAASYRLLATKFRSKLRNRYSKMRQSWAKSENIVKFKGLEHKHV